MGSIACRVCGQSGAGCAPAGELGALLRGRARLRQLQPQRRRLLRLELQLSLRADADCQAWLTSKSCQTR